MTSAFPPRPTERDRRTQPTKSSLTIGHIALACSIVFQLLATADAHAQRRRGPRGPAPDPCLENLPAPTPIPPAVRVVQLINCSNQTLLGATNAAGSAGQPLTSVFPREGTWVMAPAGSPNHTNVLTIDIPPGWANNVEKGSIAPNIWARTGCRYDIAVNKAQCETGGAGGVYDVSKAHLGPPGGTTITEWTFYQPSKSTTGATYYKDNFDISAVNGVSLTVDIQEVGGSAEDPGAPQNIFWLTNNRVTPPNSPMSVHGEDLRADSSCPAAFRLKRADLTTRGAFAKNYGFVILDDNGQPQGGDGTVACFSNCGKYKFPTEPAMDCDISDPTCYNWKTFCAGDPSQYYPTNPTVCSKDSDCPVNGACWINPGSETDHRCVLRGFVSNDQGKCDADVCTFPYDYVNPYTNIMDKSTQPPFGTCKRVDPNNTDSLCIGDDTIHVVFPHAYTWPNDPQVYADDAPLYRIIFAPGGTNVPITPAGSIPACKNLPTIYDYASAFPLCSIPIKDGAIFGIARTPPNPWSCDLGAGAGNDGVICSW
jgi:hypothetical protein